MPKYRDWLNKNSAVVTILAVLILIGALVAIIYENKGPGAYKPYDVYFYDLGNPSSNPMDKLFPSKSNQFPPIAAPSGKVGENGLPMGVRAYVMACGDCSDRSKVFVAYIETYSKDAKETLENMQKPSATPKPPMSNADDMMKLERGHLISLPDGEDWQPFNGPGGNKIMETSRTKCGDETDPTKRAIICKPGDFK